MDCSLQTVNLKFIKKFSFKLLCVICSSPPYPPAFLLTTLIHLCKQGFTQEFLNLSLYVNRPSEIHSQHVIHIQL